MPVDVKYLDGGKGAVFVMSGFVTGEELIAANREIYSRDLAAEPYFYGLVDCDAITGLNVSTTQLREVANQDLEASRYIVNYVAAIYAKDDLPFALARMWQTFVEGTGWDVRVFRSKPAAVAWIKELVLAKFGVPVTVE